MHTMTNTTDLKRPATSAYDFDEDEVSSNEPPPPPQKKDKREEVAGTIHMFLCIVVFSACQNKIHTF